MTTTVPTVLLLTSDPGGEVTAFGEAADRAGVRLRVVSDRVGDVPAAWAERAIPSSFARHVADGDRLRRALGGDRIAGVLTTGGRPAWLAARMARDLGLPWHAPEAVALCTDRLLARGRFIAASLPTPWFVGLSASADDDLGVLARTRFPCLVSASDTTALAGAIRCESLDALLAARLSLAAALHAAGAGADAALIVEGIVPGRGFVLDGVLEAGALRVFALFEDIAPATAPPGTARVRVTPARMPPEQQHVVAGHVARAALALGLHHGPLHATCRVDGETIVVLSVEPRPPDGRLARALPVVAPDRSRCTFEDVLLAHALGRSLDHYGHQAIASGVLALQVADSGRLVSIEGLEAVREMSWVTGVEVGANPGTALAPAPTGAGWVGFVYAQGAQPDDVVTTLEEAAGRLRVRLEAATATTS